jgi:hypothetical protein
MLLNLDEITRYSLSTDHQQHIGATAINKVSLHTSYSPLHLIRPFPKCTKDLSTTTFYKVASPSAGQLLVNTSPSDDPTP